MFSGIIEQTALVTQIKPSQAGITLDLKIDLNDDLALGESVACDGVCLTVTDWNRNEKRAQFFLSDETLTRSHFKNIKSQNLINIERSVKFGDRMSGHWVQGHVDGVGTVSSILKVGDSQELKITLPVNLKKYCVEKGSITVQGVSLTINSIEGDIVSLMIIPHTWTVTTLSQLALGSLVNIEVDILAKYVEKLTRAVTQ
ncbi:MAG: riboflavin synthase [Xanthomonadaceae bacterium]|nr:riboflavin synthase [Xanthomonadaceae bacterium]